MGPNRMWMFPVGFTTRRTNDVPQQRELSVKSSFHRLHGPGASQRSASSPDILRPAHPRTRGAVGRQSAAELWAHIRHLVRVWSVSVSDVGFCLFAFPPSELSKLQSPLSPSSGSANEPINAKWRRDKHLH